jgi:hypothetical protein
MAKETRTTASARKRRTREHVIADLSVHYVEGLVLRCGFTMQRIQADYGYDATIDLYNQNGELENEYIRAQIKASDNLQAYAIAGGSVYSFPVSTKDYRLWAETLLPVLFILYDARMQEAYWLDLQQYTTSSEQTVKGKYHRLRVPQNNVLGANTFFLLRQRARQLAQEYRQTKGRLT